MNKLYFSYLSETWVKHTMNFLYFIILHVVALIQKLKLPYMIHLTDIIPKPELRLLNHRPDGLPVRPVRQNYLSP